MPDRRLLQRSARHQHEQQCSATIALLARRVSFSAQGVRVKLRPKRGSNVADPYACWALNSPASFESVAINLRTLTLVRVFKERCLHCNRDAVPRFFDLAGSIDSALVWLRDVRHRQRGWDAPSEEHEVTDPHLAEHCERCQYGEYPHSH